MTHTDGMVHTVFKPPRPLRQYRGQSGHELNGRMLSTAAEDALGVSLTSDLPCELVVLGEFVHPDGRRFLQLGATTAFIEATTDHRLIDGKLRLVCPMCELRDGRHLKSCDR